ncbi:MAG: hypothetical protein U0T32_12005 [Chitinophagales bacterium]
MMFDISIIETGNGGDLEFSGHDFVPVYDIRNMPYLAMFGGNVIPDPKSKLEETQRFDYWANDLLMPNDFSVQMISKTEKLLNTTPLTSAGRVIIENAVKEDVKLLNSLATIVVSVVIVDTDRLNIILRMEGVDGVKRQITMKFEQNDDGDFFVVDFNDDFYI